MGDDTEGQQDEKRRVDLQAPPAKESPKADRAVLLILSEEESADQESAENEEQVDTQAPVILKLFDAGGGELGQIRRWSGQVGTDDHQDGNGPQEIERCEPLVIFRHGILGGAINHARHSLSASSRTLNSSFQRPLFFVLTHHNSSTPSSVIRERNRTGT